MILKKGLKNNKNVKVLQEFLGLHQDGDFGDLTEQKVKEWQLNNGLKPDGIVGPKTWDEMGIATTDDFENINKLVGGRIIKHHFLPKGEYRPGPTKKEYLFLHHTAGWHNPFNQVNQWANDTRGSIGTEYLIGGPSVRGNSSKYDGEVVKCIPDGGYGWHLGNNGSQYMHTHSVGIETCNFGQITNGKTWAGTNVHESQITTLKQSFRGYKQWHKYSDEQLKSLNQLIIHIANTENIDVRDGLVKLIKEKGIKAFDYNEKAYYGKIRGMLVHTNTREDKYDMYPCDRLVDMLLSL